MLAAPVVGKLMKMVNVRGLMTVCGLIYSLGFILFSWSTTLTHFYICSVLIGIGAAGTYLIPPSVLVTNWFEEKRGMALAVAVTGGGVGGMLFGPIMSSMIIHFGLSRTFLIFGIITAILILPATLFIIRLNPEDMDLVPLGGSAADTNDVPIEEPGLTLRESVKTLTFWLLCIVFLLNGIAIMGVQMHIPAYFEHIGYSATFAAFIFAAVNGILILGKLGFGGLHDKFGTKVSMYILYCTPIIAVLLLFAARIKLFAMLFALCSGVSAVFMTLPIALWTAELLGKKDFSVIFSVMQIFSTIGVAIGSPLTGFIFDASGSYYPAWYLYLAIYVVSLVLAMLAFSQRKTIYEYPNLDISA